MGSMMKKIFVLLVIVLIGLIAWLFFIPYVREISRETLGKRIQIEALSENMKSISIEIGTTTLDVDLAISESARQQGLSGMKSMNDNQGLLFVFDKPQYPGIWMKGMSFPIDIAWIDSNFIIVDIEKNVSPNTYPRSFEPEYLSMYVLEVNAGFFDRKGIKVGDKLRAADEPKI